MPEKKENTQKIRFPDILGNLFILHEDEKSYIDGWMSLEGSYKDLLENVQDLLKLHWDPQYAEIKDYKIYYIDVLDKYKLKNLNSEEILQEIKKLDEIFIVILHKNIKHNIIQNIPVVYDWFIDSR